MGDPKPDLPLSFCYCTDFCRSCVFCDLYGSANAANTLVCAMCRLFPDGDPIHVNLDALIPEGQHSPSFLDKGVTACPAADAQPQTSPGAEVLQALPNAAVYSRLLAVIKPYALFLHGCGWVNSCRSVRMGSAVQATKMVVHHKLCPALMLWRRLQPMNSCAKRTPDF